VGLYEISNPLDLPFYSKPFTSACSWAPLNASSLCDTWLSIADHVATLIASMTLEENFSNVIDSAAGSGRLGLLSYEWWTEALHGVTGSPAVILDIVNGSNFSYATSFPTAILLGAAFDNQLIQQFASIIRKQPERLPTQLWICGLRLLDTQSQSVSGSTLANRF